jgi:hypothetical protein
MSRRKKGRKQPHPTLRHLTGPPSGGTQFLRISDRLLPPGRCPIPRLSSFLSRNPDVDPKALARKIVSPANDSVQWYGDSTLFIGKTDESIWAALLAKPDRLVLAQPICAELGNWINAPDQNETVVAHVQNAINRAENALIRLSYIPSEQLVLKAACDYYLDLLAARKFAFDVCSNILFDSHGEAPTSDAISNFCKDNFGERAQFIGRSGRNAKVEANKCNDEALLVLAFCGRNPHKARNNYSDP